MATMGPAGILIFTRHPERTKALSQEPPPRIRSRIEAVIREFRRRARRKHKNSPSPTATRRSANTPGLLEPEVAPDHTEALSVWTSEGGAL
jgi:hypothetical protein